MKLTRSNSDEYKEGLTDGFVDGMIISEKPNQGQHTLEKFNQVESSYKDSIYSFSPTLHQMGYADGVDCAAIYLREV